VKRVESPLAAREVSDDLARWTKLRLAIVTAPAATPIATTAITSRRPVQFAPNVILRLCALYYALTACPPIYVHVFAARAPAAPSYW
jgi:hypothetical protein